MTNKQYQLSPDSVEYYLKNPVEFAIDQFGITPYPEQAELLNCVIVNRKWVAWRSGHGPGKSTGWALLVLEWLYLYPNARVVCTAPKKEQIFDILWAEIGRILKQSLLKDDYVWTKTKIYLIGREQTCVALARTSRTPEAMAGQHAENMLYLFDEASGIDSEVFTAAEGSQTTAGAVMGMAGNPTQTQGYFFNAFHKDRNNWHTIHTSVENHPNVIHGYAKRIAQKWGKDSDVYRVRVLGEFPTGDPNTFITLSRVEAAINREVEPEGAIELGVDVARFGNDRTIILGRQGLHVFKEHTRLARSSIPEVAGSALNQLNQLRVRTGYTGMVRIKVDDSGVGGGVTDLLRLEESTKGIEVIACNFGGAGNDEYDDEATIMWANLRDLIDSIALPEFNDDVDGDTSLIGEVSLRRFGMTPKGKIKIEPKQVFKDRVGLSPDYADALVLAFADGALAIDGGFESIQSTTDWG